MAIPRITLPATADFALNDAAHDTIGSWQIHVSGTWTGNIVTKGWISGNGLTSSDAQAIAYKPMKTGTLTDPTATAITANGCYIIPSDGLHVLLSYTRSSGTIVIDAIPLDG